MADTFTMFSMLHGLLGLVTLVVLGGVIVAGRTAESQSPEVERKFRWGWIAFLVVVQLTRQIWVNLPELHDPQRTLPLHICDVVPWIGVAALIFKPRWLKSLTFFWGIALSIWALIFPGLSVGPETFKFWLFWLGHIQIIATAAYLVFVIDYEPTLRDLGFAYVVTLAYAAVIVPINIALGADYGFLGDNSYAEALGPFPERIAVLMVLVLVAFFLCYSPWWWRRRKLRESM